MLAVGNESRGDDGLGPALAALLEAESRPDVEVVIDFELQVEHALELAGRRLAIFVDAGHGTVAPFELRAIGASPAFLHTTHALAPEAVLDNYQRFRSLGMVGLYGLYEALDLTPARLPVGQSVGRVRSYMAHHHGMSLVALANVLQDDVMVRRFHADPRLQTVELLLQEQLPVGAPIAELPPAVVTSERVLRTQVTLTPWREAVQPPTPRVHFLSNGSYGVMMTSAGAGYSQWRDLALTRWRADTTLEDGGTWLYRQDLDRGSLTSPTFQPLALPGGDPQAYFYPYKAEFNRREDDLALKLEVAVAAEDDVEIRHLVLTNHGDDVRRLRVTSYGEVVLASHEADQRHPERCCG